MSENKYNPYVSQKPTDGDPLNRSYKRRSWKASWQGFIDRPGWNFERWARRYAWAKSWRGKFKDK